MNNSFGQNDGPTVKLTTTCMGCKHLKWDKDRGVEDHNNYCGHQSFPIPKNIGYRYDTPTWCPLVNEAVKTWFRNND